VARYRGKLSGPLLDRIDLVLDVSVITEAELSARSGGDPTPVVRARVSAARNQQLKRQGKANALLSPDEIEQHCATDHQGEQLLKRAFEQLDLSARGYHRVLKVARSIADLAGSADIAAAHIAEAVQYRRGAAT
jgi:magnesium chelatase family protein